MANTFELISAVTVGSGGHLALTLLLFLALGQTFASRQASEPQTAQTTGTWLK
jgi:hypothetical protein